MKAYWTHPCAACGQPCDKDAKHCRACSLRMRTWAKLPLVLPPAPPPQPRWRYELYCFNCGRGIGHKGVLIVTRNPPTRRPDPCRTCGGVLFVREIGSPLTPIIENTGFHQTRKVT